MALAMTAVRSSALSFSKQMRATSFVRPACAAFQSQVPATTAESPQKMAVRSMSAETATTGGFMSRMALTAEVLVSKIFPAGFGWQAASCVADQSFGLSADSAGFAVMTGLGDFTGVFLGHSLFYLVKDGPAKLGSNMQTATWLASSAFLAGTAWQPTVNVLAAAGLGFNPVAMGTGAITGACFMVGLRLGRTIYGGFMPAIAAGTSENLVADAQLSVAIGGGTGCFVGTDAGSLDGNWMRPVLGIEESTPDLLGCVKAGSSTLIGFGVVQTVENLAIPAGNCWTD